LSAQLPLTGSTGFQTWSHALKIMTLSVWLFMSLPYLHSSVCKHPHSEWPICVGPINCPLWFHRDDQREPAVMEKCTAFGAR
jgi:hypothetical protein